MTRYRVMREPKKLSLEDRLVKYVRAAPKVVNSANEQFDDEVKNEETGGSEDAEQRETYDRGDEDVNEYGSMGKWNTRDPRKDFIPSPSASPSLPPSVQPGQDAQILSPSVTNLLLSSPTEGPLRECLQAFIKGGKFDMTAAVNVIHTRMMRGEPVREGILQFAEDVANVDVTFEYPEHMYFTSQISQFQVCTILMQTIVQRRSTLALEVARKRANDVQVEVADFVQFDPSVLTRTHMIPTSDLEDTFKRGQVVDMSYLELSRSRKLQVQLQHFLHGILLRICTPADSIQLYHYHPVKGNWISPEETQSPSTRPLPADIVQFLTEMLMDAVNLAHGIVKSPLPPSDDDRTTDFFMSLGSSPGERLERLEALKRSRSIIIESFLPKILTDAIREIRYCEITEVREVVSCKRRKHSKPSSAPRHNNTLNKCTSTATTPSTSTSPPAN